ncbi:hypothetical protein EC957_002583 [Mortierella hygrophila]|uniref:Galactose oxidase n=1 Tax=Mortierella hygrophila TaxID=979708 RepID=A0A9P6K1J9_9FUNG|nr:hypothetical protein EC957_002583 [Mortierella hygrophila]
MNGSDATVVPTLDQSHLIFLGASGQGDPLLMSYDIGADSWAPFRSDPNPPRSAVGAALDLDTGVIVVQGGFIRNFGAPLSSEIDILTPNGGMDQWKWTKGAPTTALRPIFQPIVVYLPTRKATLIIGGTNFENNNIAGLQNFDFGYLVTTSTVKGITTVNNTVVNLTASEMAVPVSRLSPCYTVLENGDLFMYGGATFSNSLNEAWILNAGDLTWKAVSIGQNPTAGRAGATCQRISPNHIMVVGGKSTCFYRYSAAINTPARSFSQPQIGIIDTKQWVWTATYTPLRPGLPLGAIIGIIVGSCLLLGVALFFAGRTLWKRRKSNSDRKINRDSVSAHPLMGSDSALTNDSNDRFHSTPSLISPSSGPISGKMGSELHSASLTSNKDGRSLPLMIIPYPASTTYNSSSLSVAGTNSPERGSTPTWNSYKSKGAKSKVSLPESERLPQTMADMQYGYYVKTTLHNKQYEKRQIDLNRQQPNNGLNRKITSNQYAILNDGYHDDIELATAVLNLKDVEMGEESIMTPLQSLETGTILVSSHLDDQGSYLISPTGPTSPTGHTPPMPMRGIPQRFSNVPSKAELNDDDDEELYQPGVGGSITKLNAIKAAKAKAKAAEVSGAGAAPGAGQGKGQQNQNQDQSQQQQQQAGRRAMSPLSEELISKESEVLVDNRRGRQP